MLPKKRMYILSLIFLLLISFKSYSVAIPANTDISNQAILTYTDAGGSDQEMTSNIVITRVQQIYAVAIEPNRSIRTLAGLEVIFSHVVTNNGNGIDDIVLSHDYENSYQVKFYKDSNKDGVLNDNERTEITRLNGVGVGEDVYILTSVVTPINETGTNSNTILATSVGDGTKLDSATQTIIYSEYAKVSAEKSLTPTSGEADVDRQVTFRIKVYNTTETNSPDFELKDILDERFEYVSGSGKWYPHGSNSPRNLTDENGNDPSGINYTVSDNEITFAINNIPGDTTANDTGGYLEFKVIVPAGTPGGNIENMVTFDYSNGVINILGEETNIVTYEVLSFAGLEFTGHIIDQASPGETITFINKLTNTGNANETFNITVDLVGSDFPTATKDTYKLLKLVRTSGEIIDNPDSDAVVQILEQNEVSELIDSNGDGIVDTGIVKPGETISILLQLTLDESIEDKRYQIDKYAESISDSSITAKAEDILKAILPTTVDLTNDMSIFDNSNAPGAGIGPEGAPVTTLTTTGVTENESERTLTYTLYVNNLSEFAIENYDLAASSDKFISNPVLSSLNVTFTDESGSVITNTGDIEPRTAKKVYMKVVVERYTYAQEIDVFVEVKSTITGARDIKYEKVVVIPYREILLTPDFQEGVVIPGGKIGYKIYITNLGNIVEAGRMLSPLTFYTTDSLGFTSKLHWDRTRDGEYTPGKDGYISYPFAAKITPGETEYRFLVVDAPIDAERGDVNTTLVGATSPPKYGVELIINTIEADTRIITEELTINKYQSLDGINYTKSVQQSEPGGLIYYKVETINVGEASARSVFIEDEVPFYTTLENASGSSAPGMNTVPSYEVIDENGNGEGTYYRVDDIPQYGERGTLRANIGELGPNEKAVMYFHVRIDG